MEILTSRLGKVSFLSKEVYYFHKGIYGFPGEKEFIFLKLKENEPFIWLQSIEKPDLAFVLVNPSFLFQDYNPHIGLDELEDIKATDSKSVKVYVIVTLSPDMKDCHANLLAPLVINPRKKLGKQVVLKDTGYKIQHFIFSQLERKRPNNISKTS
jgi:flagellar assembly factor FliW